jgi:hypothetical protein
MKTIETKKFMVVQSKKKNNQRQGKGKGNDTFPFWSWVVVILLAILLLVYVTRPTDLERVFETFVARNSTIELSPKELMSISRIQNEGNDENSSIHSSNEDELVLKEIYIRLLKVHPFTEKLTLQQGAKSYSINKRQIYLCLKDEHGKYYAMNMLMYVALHELAHCMCDEIGHTDKFHEIFDHLLEMAHDRDVYDKTIQPVSSYCNYERKTNKNNNIFSTILVEEESN